MIADQSHHEYLAKGHHVIIESLGQHGLVREFEVSDEGDVYVSVQLLEGPIQLFLMTDVAKVH